MEGVEPSLDDQTFEISVLVSPPVDGWDDLVSVAVHESGIGVVDVLKNFELRQGRRSCGGPYGIYAGMSWHGAEQYSKIVVAIIECEIDHIDEKVESA